MQQLSKQPRQTTRIRKAVFGGVLAIAAASCSTGDVETASNAPTTPTSTTTAPASPTTATTTTEPTTATTAESEVEPERVNAAVDAVRTLALRLNAVRVDDQAGFEGLDEVAEASLLEDILAGIQFDRENQIRTSGDVEISETAEVEPLDDGRLRVTICVADSTTIDASDAPNVEIIDRTTDDTFGRPILVIYLVDDSGGTPLVTGSLLPSGRSVDCEIIRS